jgi:hypothetical protein
VRYLLLSKFAGNDVEFRGLIVKDWEMNRFVNGFKRLNNQRFANIIYILVLAFALLELVAWMPTFYIPSDAKTLSWLRIDFSTEFLIPYFFEKGVQFGKDIIFSYGPLGFIKYSKYHPATYHWMLLGQIFLSIIFVTSMWKLIPKDRGKVFILLMGMFLCSVIMIMLTGRTFPQDSFLLSFIVLSVVSFYFVEGKKISMTYLSLLFASALTTLIKVSFFPVVFTAVFIISISEMVDRKKRLPVSLFVFSVAFVLLWLVSKQNLLNLVEYLKSLGHMVGGYTDAMSNGDLKGHRLMEIILYCLSGSGLIVLLFFVLRPKERLLNLLPMSAIALFLFVIFKHSFVRHDTHHAIEAGSMLIFLLFIFVALSRSFNFKGVAVKIFYMYVGISILASFYIVSKCGGFKHNNPLEHLKRQMEGIQLVAQGTNFKQTFDAEREAIKKFSCLPVIDESVDLYPDNLTIVMGADLYYKPRPTIVSHGAYTPYLARLNAEHLKGNNAPQVVLFRVETIDDRYPSIDDGISWPEIWTRYKLDGEANEYLILRRSHTPSPYSKVKVKELDAKFGELISTPDIKGWIWAEIEIKHTFIGRLIRFLFKLPRLSLRVNLRDGQEKMFRIIPEMVRTGFLLSPLVEDNKDFNELMEKDQNLIRRKSIRAISLMIENWWNLSSKSSVFFSDDIKVRYYKVDLK